MQTYILNDFGKLEWTKGTLRAIKSYSWCDRIIVVDESRGRLVVSDTLYSTFDFTGWTPVTKAA